MGARFSAPVQTGPGARPASCKMGTGSFPWVKCSRDMLLTTHPLLVPWSWKSRAIPSTDPLGHTGPVTGSLYLFFNPAVYEFLLIQDAEIIACFLRSACQFSLTPVPSLQTDHSTCHLFSAVISSQTMSMHMSDPDDPPPQPQHWRY